MKRPPGPGTFGTIRRLVAVRGRRNEFLEGVARHYGDVAYVRAGPTGFYLINHPDLANDALDTNDQHFERIPGERRYSARVVNDALFASEGSFHARHRVLIEPIMYGDVPSEHAKEAVEFAARMTASWRAGQAIDAVDTHERMTTAFMIKALFGEDVAEPRGKAIAQALLGAIAASDAIPLAPTRVPDRLPLPSKKRFRRALDELHRLIEESALEGGTGRTDVLSKLVTARDSDGRGMTFEQARDEAFSLFRGQKRVASAALSWTWYLLSQHPEAESRFHEEVDSVLRERLPTYEDMPRLPYTLMAFREALRLYGPSWVVARKCVAPHEAGGHVIPPGATVLMSSYVHQRDPRFWDDPTRFDPERFAGGAPPLATSGYFPQGAGPKRCPGMDLLPVMAVMSLATVGREWRLVVSPGHPVTPKATVFMSPRGGLPVTLERRGLS